MIIFHLSIFNKNKYKFIDFCKNIVNIHFTFTIVNQQKIMKMKNKLTTPIHPIFAIILLCNLFIFSSCSHKYYAPNEADLLTLREKNDVHFSGSLQTGGNDETDSYNLQLGYSPINHLAFTTSYFNIESSSTDGTIKGNGNIWNGAIGAYYFEPVNTKLIKKRFRKKEKQQAISTPSMRMKKGLLFDFYLGHSKGNVYNFYQNDDCETCRANSHFRFTKNYGQFGLHYLRETWGISYAFRIGKLNYFDGDIFGNRSAISLEDEMDIQFIEDNNIFNLKETSIRLHLGPKHFRFYLSASIVDDRSFGQLDVINDVAQMGVTVDIDAFFKKVKNNKD